MFTSCTRTHFTFGISSTFVIHRLMFKWCDIFQGTVPHESIIYSFVYHDQTYTGDILIKDYPTRDLIGALPNHRLSFRFSRTFHYQWIHKKIRLTDVFPFPGALQALVISRERDPKSTTLTFFFLTNYASVGNLLSLDIYICFLVFHMVIKGL